MADVPKQLHTSPRSPDLPLSIFGNFYREGLKTVGSIPIDHVSIEHHQPQRPVPRSCSNAVNDSIEPCPIEHDSNRSSRRMKIYFTNHPRNLVQSMPKIMSYD